MATPTNDLALIEEAAYRYPEGAWRLGPVSVRIGAGELVAVIGPNGSGKSTLLKLAAGVLPPESGRVCLAGRDLAGLPRREIARQLGYLPQGIHYGFDYTVEEVVAMGRFPHLSGMGFLTRRDIEVVARCMEETETVAYRDRALSHLSGGERQRVLLASILAQEPQLLLLDEPTTALDIHHQALFFRLLRRLVAAGMGVGVVTHDLNLASLYCDRLVLMAEGACRREGVPEDILTPDTLSDVYGERVRIQTDPQSGRPLVLPVAEERTA